MGFGDLVGEREDRDDGWGLFGETFGFGGLVGGDGFFGGFLLLVGFEGAFVGEEVEVEVEAETGVRVCVVGVGGILSSLSVPTRVLPDVVLQLQLPDEKI